ncbi:hypothetical protein J2N86_08440 [Legionella lytica]|uniref:Uncharacterized protein n=1 Tax=Legionella lytica TaxID=96232 RepID=A0ABY4Y5J4_9GAMM|nr:hypothetical protein [Legionella lytica]USQ12737.1 hypothetical protein J2N86_08440 [Legionella lytica]
MSLTTNKVLAYLKETNPLTAINNHKVMDEYNCKTGQMPLTISVSIWLIDGILNGNTKEDIEDSDVDEYDVEDSEEEEKIRELGDEERKALARLQTALGSLPTSFSLQTLYSVVTTGFDGIQKELLESVNDYLNNIQEITEHKLLLKAVVLVLKILEYDLSKNPGPITKSGLFFSVEILSDAKRIENHGIVKGLLNRIIEQYNEHYPAPTVTVTAASVP